MKPINELISIIQNKTIPNAMLFTGSAAQEKREAAFIFVKTVNCLDIESEVEFVPCNRCRSCVKINSEMHPDIITVAPEPDKPLIKISKIREVLSSILSRPHEAKMRMVIIEDADCMNTEASNALLKILEEPPERTFFVLIAKDMSSLLPTIISRCRHINFKPLSSKDIAQKLADKYNIPFSTAVLAAKLSDGNIERASMFANVNSDNYKKSGINWLNRRRWLIKQIFIIVKPDKNISILLLSALALAEKLSKEPNLISDSLLLIKFFLRDMAFISSTIDNRAINYKEHIINLDFFNVLLECAEKLPKDYPLAALESLHQAEIKLQSNSSTRLILETLFLNLIMMSKR